MKTKLKLLFYLKNNQLKKEGLSPVMGRIQVGKSMSQFSLKLKADVNLRDPKAGRMIGKSTLSQTINREINRVNLIIHARYKELLEVNIEVDQRVGIDYSEAALELYTISYNTLDLYIQKKLNLSDIPFKSLTHSFIEDYYQHLRVVRKFSIGTKWTDRRMLV